MNRQDRMEIFRAINNVSKRQNEMEQKLDAVMQILNAQTNERITVGNEGIDDIVDMVVAHNEAIDGLAEMITESEVQYYGRVLCLQCRAWLQKMD